MVERATVGGTPKSSTIPPSEIGSAATLNDISTWARNRPIMGVHEVRSGSVPGRAVGSVIGVPLMAGAVPLRMRTEEHTSELQSHGHLVCRHLLETKNQ